jgi:hypothetical protein
MEGRASFRPVRVSGTTVWLFLESWMRLAPTEPAVELSPVASPPKETDPLVRSVREIVQTLLSAGRTEATPQDVVALLRASERLSFTEQQVGIAL